MTDCKELRTQYNMGKQSSHLKQERSLREKFQYHSPLVQQELEHLYRTGTKDHVEQSSGQTDGQAKLEHWLEHWLD